MELFSVEVLFDDGGLFDGELGGLGTGDGLGIGFLHGMEFVCPCELGAAFLWELGVGALGGLGFALRCLRSLVDRACTLAVGVRISFWWSCKFLVLSEPDLLLSRTDLSLVATVEGGGYDWDHHRGTMTGKCAAGVWMVGVGVSLRDADPRVLGVLLLVLIF